MELCIYILKRDLSLGLSMSYRLNYEAAALTTQPQRLDKIEVCFVFYLNNSQSLLRNSHPSNESNDVIHLVGRKKGYLGAIQNDVTPRYVSVGFLY